jgi:hypothetical protein
MEFGSHAETRGDNLDVPGSQQSTAVDPKTL